MLTIGLGIDTTAATNRWSCRGAGCNAFPRSTDLSSSTNITALATVFAIGVENHTRATTVDLACWTRDLTKASLANKAVFAYLATPTTVSAVRLNIDTRTIAVGLSCWTGHLALSCSTNLPRLAHLPTLTTVFAIALNIHTRARTFCLPHRTEEDTLAF